MLEPHWRRINRAYEHIRTLDRSIREWLDGDSYRVVKEQKTENGMRRTAYVARIKPTPDHWSDLISEAAHMMRSALDHQAFALNTKGYADAHNGAKLPAEGEAESSFPIFGNVSQRGTPIDGEQSFRRSASYRNMPPGAITVIEGLQPYKRGEDFRRDPLWAIHELSRIDKHRIDLQPTATLPMQTTGQLVIERAAEVAIGTGGPMYDGKELSYWVIPEGYPEPDAHMGFSRGIAFGEGTPLGNQPVIPTLNGIRDYIRFRVLFPLDKFL